MEVIRQKTNLVGNRVVMGKEKEGYWGRGIAGGRRNRWRARGEVTGD